MGEDASGEELVQVPKEIGCIPEILEEGEIFNDLNFERNDVCIENDCGSARSFRAQRKLSSKRTKAQTSFLSVIPGSPT
ncbi:hypothetical protein Hdeb2414_s0022g00614201 [Helianthus debilis subsp. tardiflorus]